MQQAKSADLPTKILLAVLVIIVSYLVALVVLTSFFVPSFSMMDMMHHLTSSTQTTLVLNLVAFSLALLAGTLVFSWLRTGKADVAAGPSELDIIKKVLSDDEKAVLDEIRRAGAITQDSLRFRLEWSKAKLSRILTNLDKMNIVQRERVGKTYKVFITEEKGKR